MNRWLLKYWRVFLMWQQRQLTYRLRIVIWAVVDIANFIIFPFLWLSIFGDAETIGGYTREGIVTYYIVVALVSIVFTSHISRVTREDIMSGFLNNIIIKPVNYYWWRLTSEISYKALSGLIALFCLFIIIIFLPAYITFPTEIFTIVMFVLSVGLAFMISHTIEFAIGLSSFWLGDNRALTHLFFILDRVFSGRLAPLALFPLFFQGLAAASPFTYLAYFPSQVYLGQLNNSEILTSFGIGCLWLVGITIFMHLIWLRGIKKYEGVGI